MYLERLLPAPLAIAAAPGCFLRRLRHPELVSFGLLANLVRLSRLPRFAAIDAVIDVGANAGQFAYMAHVAWPRVPVHSFEPDPRVHARLEAVRTRFGITGRSRAAAVGREAGEATLHVQADSVNSSLLAHAHEPDRERIAVPCVRLDDEFPAGAPPSRALLKVDTQGTELDVLRGSRALLPRCAGVLLEATVLPSYSGATRLSELLDFLGEAGFVPFDLVDVLRTPAAQGAGLRELDLLFVPEGD
jgi:FkbM family methyltransferase